MIESLQRLVNEKREEVIQWVDKKRKEVTLPINSSFDIRDNGIKASIVDSNLFPAGFNNLSWESKKLASEYFKQFIPSICETKNILVIPEAHTRNLFYLSNLNSLREILINAGYNVVLGSIRGDIEETLEVVDSNKQKLTLEKMKHVNGNIQTKSFEKGLILLNNDFSVKAPELLNDVKECITPPLKLGWMHRKKSNHFKHFCKLIKEFSDNVGIDDWILCPRTKEVDDINFGTGKNIEKVAEVVDKIIAESKEKYEKYGVDEKPYVFVKDNSGTYGMGIISVHSGKEILELNSKQRRKMKAGKKKSLINSVIVQDGISTKYKVNGRSAEPVLYSVGGRNVGGFMRMHDSKDEKASLNAPDAKFDVLLKDNITRPIIDFVDENKELSLYALLANIANIAIGKEMEEVQ
ncbi:glutamate--cysteine ligase [Candidatus Woesearchaeota archaeon]|nr:glutamate--cysteine ligase [Candidatus Woesearchaeota archaeon]|tara:strand:+ start:287 stop:1510 length:1224 start_codon:yes stop_codon:yes gene_type:complete